MDKICCNCNENKDISEFHIDKNGKDGHSAWCKKCRSIYDKEYSLRKKLLNNNICIHKECNVIITRNAKYCQKHSQLCERSHRYGKAGANLGKKFSKETRLKMSINHTDVSMSNNINWKGGKSFELYSPEFNNSLKEEVRKVHNYKCFECGISQEELKTKLSIHHIDYNKKNNKIENLVPLCNSCHSKTNFSREYCKEHYENKITEELCQAGL